MVVWVVVASKHGATREIAEAIADELGHRHRAELRDAGEIDGFGEAEAVVLGSAVYMGRWLAPARKLLEERSGELAGRPTWLFSSGPVGAPPLPEDAEPAGISKTIAAISARGHEIFAGKLDRSKLTRRERLLVAALRVPEGDFREWDSIRVWAEAIGRELGG